MAVRDTMPPAKDKAEGRFLLFTQEEVELLRRHPEFMSIADRLALLTSGQYVLERRETPPGRESEIG